jgi:hypothetical protein
MILRKGNRATRGWLAFAKHKKWSISVLLREALEKTSPEALKAKTFSQSVPLRPSP